MSKIYKPIIKEGTHLASSKDTNGAYRGTLLDNETNQIVGQAEWEVIDEEDSISLLETLGIIALSVVGSYVIQKATPHIENWWSDKMLPMMKAKWDVITRKNQQVDTIIDTDVDEGITYEILSANENDISEFNNGVVSILNEYKANKCNNESQEKIIAIVAAAAFIAEKIRNETDHSKESYNEFEELQNSLKVLSSQEVTDMINDILENNDSILDRNTLNLFNMIFDGGQFLDGHYKPIKNNKIRELLHIDNLTA